MHFDELLCMSLHLVGFPWFLMDSIKLQWIQYNFNWFHRISMHVIEFGWISFNLYGFHVILKLGSPEASLAAQMVAGMQPGSHDSDGIFLTFYLPSTWLVQLALAPPKLKPTNQRGGQASFDLPPPSNQPTNPGAGKLARIRSITATYVCII